MLNVKKKGIFLKAVTASIVITSAIMFNSSVSAQELNGETTDINKAWNIKFNQNIDFNDEIKNDIVLEDSSGNVISTDTRLGSDGKTIIMDAPKGGYKEGEKYSVNIGNKIHSTKNKQLKDDVKFNFVVKKAGNVDSRYKYQQQINGLIDSGVNKILKDGVEDDWEPLVLERYGKDVPQSYLVSLQNNIKLKKGIMDQPTDYERTTLALMSVGKDPSNFEGYNLIDKIYNNKDMESQGVNAYIFALIALDSGNFNIPDNGIWTRDKLISTILSERTEDGGWSYGGNTADPDITGMALTALAPYKNQKNVSDAIDKSVDKLATMQNSNGGFSSWGTENSESCSQVIIALCSNNIDPTGNKFTKNGKNLIDGLFQYTTDDSGFCHTKGTGSNTMSTEQALEALESYKMFKENLGLLYKLK